MPTKWRVQCSLCGQQGSITTYTDAGKPKHKGKMSGKCPRNPSGGNFGHKPVWVRESTTTTCRKWLGKENDIWD